MSRKTNLAIVAAGSIAVILTIAAFLANPAMRPHAVAGKGQRAPCPRDKCSSLIVGKELTADGSVILAHNEDLSNYSAHHYIYVPHASHGDTEVVTTFYGAEVPQVPETYAYTGTTIFDISYYPGAVTSGINECQVAVVNNASYIREPEDVDPQGRIIWTELTKFALERADTAAAAVEIIGELASTYKLGADTGTMYGITDPNEGWWVEVAQDGQWVAEKVPSDAASARANIFRIGEVDFGSENFKYSADLVSYATDKGWYNPVDAFNFAAVYADQERLTSEYNLRRENRVVALLNDRVMAKTVDPRLIMTIWRDHYEGTQYDLTYGHTQGSPHQTDERTLCRIDTEISTVIQSRSWLPSDIGAICWRAMATPCTSIYTPWYMGSHEVPEAYQTGVSQFTKKSAYWVFRNLSKSVDMRYRSLVVDKVTRVREEFEGKEFDSQAEIEQKALVLYNENQDKARAYLAKYSSSMAKKSMQKAKSLYKYAERN